MQRGELCSQDQGSKSGQAGTGVVAAGVPVSGVSPSLLAWQCLTLSGQGCDAGLGGPDRPRRKKAWFAVSGCPPKVSSGPVGPLAEFKALLRDRGEKGWAALGNLTLSLGLCFQGSNLQGFS